MLLLIVAVVLLFGFGVLRFVFRLIRGFFLVVLLLIALAAVGLLPGTHSASGLHLPSGVPTVIPSRLPAAIPAH